MSLTPNSTSSDSVTSWSSQDSQHESRDFSVLRMLNELGVVPSQERGSSIFAVQENGKYKTAQGCNLAGDEVITRSFLRGRSQWIDEPIITSWREPSIGILEKLKVADQLFNEWSRIQPKPFDPFFDRLWLETASTLRDAGLPWHNNNLNMPEEVDTSWPFHFKDFERVAILAKGRRVSHADASGYITNWMEGNYYGIRALKQELSRQFPTQQPVFLTHHLETEIAETASKLFGLEWHEITLQDSKELIETISLFTLDGKRPIIFAATLANTLGESDDIAVIDLIAKRYPLILHLDACRVFDYLTTADDELRQEFRLPRLRLHHSQVGVSGCIFDGEIFASTIVTGGSNAYVFPPPVVVLKPKLLGSQSPATVEYVRGTDSTLSGSRDSLGPLMLCLQELRFGYYGLRDVYKSCALKKQALLDKLARFNVSVDTSKTTLDLKIHMTCPSTAQELIDLGAKTLDGDKFLLTVQPSAQPEDFNLLLDSLSPLDKSLPSIPMEDILNQPFTSTYCLPAGVFPKIWSTVQNFKIAARSSCGYPLNQAPYSALGPAVGPFLTLKISEKWAVDQATRILKKRMQAFGLITPEAQKTFGACFTTGSTMGNRIGLHNALAQYPKANVYFSSASHYSVKKTVRDCDDLTSCWRPDRSSRFAEIPADEHGRMIPEALVQQALLDRAEHSAHGEEYQMIIFANLGTTFTGGRDDLSKIGNELASAGIRPAYIHVDGALDLGFVAEGLRLGPPAATCTPDGIPIVQGITISHHKAFGIMVSGEIMGYCPNSSAQFGTLTSTIDPRAVLETWLFEQLYNEKDLVSVWQYCLENASLLRRLLAHANVSVQFNSQCIITLLERPPPWLVNEFQLAPEGTWVHFITMPHVSPNTITRFARSLSLIDAHCATAFEYIHHSLGNCLHRSVRLQRLRCQSTHVGRVLDIANRTVLKDPRCQILRDELGLRNLTQLKASFVYSTMSFVAVDEEDNPLVVFLAEADSKKIIRPNVLLVEESSCGQVQMLQDVAVQLFGHIAQLMDLRVETSWWSYKAISYETCI